MKNEPKLSAIKVHKIIGQHVLLKKALTALYLEVEASIVEDLSVKVATALEEQKKEATFTLVNTTKPFFYAGYEAGKKDERQKVLSEVEGWMVELRKQAGLCNDAANSHLEQQRASRLVEMICDIVAKLEEMKK